IALVDRDMKLLMINEAGAARFKRTPEEMAGKDISQFLRGSSGEGSLARFKSVVETGKIVDFEDDRNNKVFYTKVYPVFDESGDVKWIAITGEDITYRKRIEQELLRTQKIESIGILAGGIAHDYNNFLTAMMSNISLAMLGMEPGSDARVALEDAEKAARRARDLTMQLLTFAKGGSPVKKICRIEDILTESVSLGLRGSNIRPEYVIPANTWNVRVDQGQMSQVFNNLTINAKQAMPSGGKLLVSAENVTIDGSGPPDMEPGRYVRVLFIDEGIGIPPQYISRVFDPYFSTKQEGSGLGLATSFSIIKQHGGRISIESEPGTGTEVQLYIPATDEAVSEEPGVSERLFNGTGRVLVMDDLPEIHKVAEKILARLGLESEFAFEGREAIEKYKASMEKGRPFDLVIMDLTVPGGLGGKEAVESLLILDPGAKVIVSSGYSSDPIMADFQRYGFAGVISKPYTVKSVSDVIRTILADEE
ncbi:MAG TPA: ATP-binding protein, partial [Candidatus Krumholzibacterium sp.]|nr:ATP-binding protein [Candidatus Krumholzibacterium sp.]